MKLQVTKENLNKALSAVSRVASSRNALPILNNLLLKAEGNQLSITATNLDIGITYRIGSKITSAGSLTIPARLTQEFVASLPGGVISLEQEDNKMHIELDNYTSTINGMTAEEFPVMPEISDGTTIDVPSSVLKKGLQQTVFAASSDDSRPVLTGVYLHAYDKHLYVVATDSYRLAEKRLTTAQSDVSLLIPATALNDLLRILEDTDDKVEITFNTQQVLFRVGDVELTSRLIDGKYPDYRKLIPATFATKSTLKKEDFVTVTKVSSLFARESAGSITISVDSAAAKISINSVASQLGENTASANAVVEGDDGDVTINSRYLLDALAVFSSPEVAFGFNGRLEPSVLTDPKSDDYKHVIMPLRS